MSKEQLFKEIENEDVVVTFESDNFYFDVPISAAIIEDEICSGDSILGIYWGEVSSIVNDDGERLIVNFYNGDSIIFSKNTAF